MKNLPHTRFQLGCRICWLGLIGFGCSLSGTLPAIASEPADPQIELVRSPYTCPDTLDVLVPQLLQDLPSYANRVTQRSFRLEQIGNIPGLILLAGEPEYEPLSLRLSEPDTVPIPTEPDQIFFTTLERQYVGNVSTSIQHYHWLFLTRSETQWRVALMFSIRGDYPAGQPPSPPYDSSQGAIAQAVRLWLRDCAARKQE